MLYRYCKSLFVFYTLKTQFDNSAFQPNTNLCADDINQALIDAKNIYLFIDNNIRFINEMKKGCDIGGNNTKCKIKNSDVDDILIGFNNSYHNYIQYPTKLCTSFAEFTNNLESLFITGGCYLDKTNKEICELYGRGVKCFNDIFKK